MTLHSNTISAGRLARAAGFLALAILALGTLAGYVNGRLVVADDATATVENILASESLFRAGIVSTLMMYTVFIFYALVLYRLLRPVNANHALAMLVLALVGVPIAMLTQINQSIALLLLSGADYLGVFTAGQLDAQVMLFLKLSGHGNVIGALFWGLWLFPLGILVYRSGFFPRILGVMLMVGCFGWLGVFFQRFLLPDFEALAYTRYAAHIAELSWMLWLLVKGVDVEAWVRRAA